MTDVTRILNAIEQGDSQATEELLPLVYDELRLLAAQKMAQELPGQTLQATALVHEAYIRLVEAKDQSWNSRGHFFRAAAEAMRRILIENARRKGRAKYGGGFQRVELSESAPVDSEEHIATLGLRTLLAWRRN
jgi:RNA polymerase sigma factor (TIGR02999 family)